MSRRDYYDVLGVSRGATDQEIKSSYRKLAFTHHPDRNPGSKDAEEKFKEAAEAYAVLADPDKRRMYDRFGHAGLGGAATGGFDEDSGDGAVRDFLRSLETRVHTVWAARRGLRDIAIAKVNADEFAFVRTVVRIDAVIRTTGLPARQVPVTL